MSKKASAAPAPRIPEIYPAPNLMAREFPETDWIIRSLLPPGLSILVAAPKIGKSWMALSIALAVCFGGAVFGRYQAAHAGVLYLDLEMPPRRRKARLAKLLAAIHESEAPAGLLFSDWWPKIDDTSPDVLAKALDAVPEVRLVIVDTVAKIWPAAPKGANAFYAEYQALAGLKDIADQRNIALLILHHQNKSEHDDPLNAISGTAAFQAAADGIWIASRRRGDSTASLYVTGREVEDRKIELAWSAELASWAVTDDPLDRRGAFR